MRAYVGKYARTHVGTQIGKGWFKLRLVVRERCQLQVLPLVPGQPLSSGINSSLFRPQLSFKHGGLKWLSIISKGSLNSERLLFF